MGCIVHGVTKSRTRLSNFHTTMEKAHVLDSEDIVINTPVSQNLHFILHIYFSKENVSIKCTKQREWQVMNLIFK